MARSAPGNRQIAEWSWIEQNGNTLGYDSGLAKNARVFQQSVTLTAKLWPQESVSSGSMSTSGGGGGPKWSWNTLRVQSDQLPLVIAIFSGGALLILLVFAIILWRCCVAPHRNKDYRVKMHDTSTLPTRTVVPVLPSHSAVYLDPKSGEWSVSSRVVGCWRASTGSSRHWFYNNSMLNPAALDSKCIVPRSISVPAPRSLPLIHGQSGSSLSSPVTSTPSSRRHVVGGPSSLPQISEFYPNASFCASSSVLQESLSELYCCDSNSRRGGLTKTQSLPACVRSKAKLSSADDPTDLYAKVNFSKKRKNRMRNDEAAIIAMSKSGSQFLHKDTDTLVDNEAFVVYDERTAL